MDTTLQCFKQYKIPWKPRKRFRQLTSTFILNLRKSQTFEVGEQHMFKFGNLLLRIHYFQMLQNLFWNTKTFKMRPSILEDMIDEKCKL